MKSRLLFCLAAVLGAATAQAALRAQAPRGSQLVQIPVPGRMSEVCIIPKHFPDGVYSERDTDQEKGLCELNFYQTAAICPKVNSTNPGIDVYKVPAGATTQQFEASGCTVPKGKKVAKYKLSTSCSYTPSILGYYHLSRILGGVALVPPSVLRTVDLPKHKEIGKKAMAQTKAGSLIRQTWTGLISNLNAGISSPKRDLLLTDDWQQSYGALTKNPTNEDQYSEFFNGGADNLARAKNFRGNKVMKLLGQSAGVSSLISRNFTVEPVQALVQMKDASDMIILDTIMNQQDRFGNVHAIEVFKYLENGKVATSFNMTPEEAAAAKAVKVKQMLLKDNDCGVAKDNIAVKAGLAAQLKHLDPETYARVQKLDAEADRADVKQFFIEELAFTAKDYTSVRGNLKTLAAQLRAACQKGSLKLDLDLDVQFAGAQAKAVSCQ